MYIFLFILSYIKHINIVYAFCFYLTKKTHLTICPRNHSLSVHVYLPYFISAASYSIQGMDVPVFMFAFLFFFSYFKGFSRLQLFVTPWTVAHQDPLSMESSRQEYWSGLPFPTPMFAFLMLKDFSSFQYFATSNNAAVNNLVHIYFCIVGGISSG